MSVAVIGLGSIGNRHAGNLLEAGEQVCGFDPDPERCALIEAAGGRTAKSRDRALHGAEAAIICSPNPCHLDDLKAALEAGCHVLVEKPLSHTIDNLPETLAFAKERNLLVAVAMNLRFHPVVMEARALLVGGGLGIPVWGRFLSSSYLPDWRPHKDYREGYTTNPISGGVLFDIIHEIDLAQYLLGAADVQASVVRMTGIIETSAEDCADLILRHESGHHSSIHLDYVSKNFQRFFEIQCTEGFIRGDLIKRAITVWKPGNELVTNKNFPGTFAEDYIEEVNNFLSAIRGQGGMICEAADGLNALKTVIRARQLAGLKSA